MDRREVSLSSERWALAGCCKDLASTLDGTDSLPVVLSGGVTGSDLDKGPCGCSPAMGSGRVSEDLALSRGSEIGKTWSRDGISVCVVLSTILLLYLSNKSD